MKSAHQHILTKLKKHQGKGTSQSDSSSYLGSTHFYYSISVPLRRKIAKEWIKLHRDISAKNFISTVDCLIKGRSHEEKTMAAMLLSYHPKHRNEVTLKHIDIWLNHLVGWAEIDSFCWNVFTAEEMLSNWKGWDKLIRKLSKDKNINKRRAALVLLAGPVRYSGDKKIAKLSFEIVEALKHERPILITKAVSWLLRSMTVKHKKEVAAYIKKNGDSLPKIAVRETTRKIKTGRK